MTAEEHLGEQFQKALDFLPHATEAARRAVAKFHGVPQEKVHVYGVGYYPYDKPLDIQRNRLGRWDKEGRYKETDMYGAGADFGWRNPDETITRVTHHFGVTAEKPLSEAFFLQTHHPDELSDYWKDPLP